MAVVLLVTYLCGGYVAGRMARRAGLLNGLAVFLLAVVLVALVAAVAASQTDAEAIGEGDTGATRLTSPPPRRPRPNGSAGHATTASSDVRGILGLCYRACLAMNSRERRGDDGGLPPLRPDVRPTG